MLSHATIAPAVVDPLLIEQLSESLLDKSPIHLPYLSTHPKKKALVAADRSGNRVGAHGEADHAEQRRVPFPIEDWPSVVLEGLRFSTRTTGSR